MKRSFKVSLVCKLDVEKAYNHVGWNFLVSLMEKTGFSVKLRNWIQFCASSIRMLVLVDGFLSKFFQIGRGLW